MNVEIGTEAVQFPEKEYINGIFVAVHIFIERWTKNWFRSYKNWFNLNIVYNPPALWQLKVLPNERKFKILMIQRE